MFWKGSVEMNSVLSTNKLTKQFGKIRAVDGVSLHVKKGEIYGFIGRNGAGKTTFMKMISGLSAPTDGEIALFGHSGAAARKHYSRIGNLIEAPGLYPGMTGFENLKCKALALGIHKKGYEESLLEIVGLGQAGRKKAGKYSLGMKQRLGIAMAMVGGPDFLVLDEPINGLDPQGIAEVRETLLKLRDEQGITIMISSHILEELYKVADTFGIIHQGRLVKELTREALEETCSDYLEISTDQTEAASTVIEQLGIHDYKVVGKETIRLYEGLERSDEINHRLILADVRVRELKVEQENLEDYFLKLTGGGENV